MAFVLTNDTNSVLTIKGIFARKLNGLKIFTPVGYSNTNRKRKYVIDDKTVWKSPKVLKIIRDQRYAGDMISNVRIRVKIAN